MKLKDMKETTRTVAVINNSKILVIENGQKIVPIKPICEALGIDVDSQRQKIKDDQILSSVAVLSTATGSDGKQYEMFCLPLKYVFGWLFTINPSNVKEEAKEAVIQYKEACYDVLFQSFTDASEFLSDKQVAINHLMDEHKAAKKNFQEANKTMKATEKALDDAVGMSFDVWLANNRQMNLFAPNEQE
jgi:hypothetical protein